MSEGSSVRKSQEILLDENKVGRNEVFLAREQRHNTPKNCHTRKFPTTVTRNTPDTNEEHEDAHMSEAEQETMIVGPK